MAFNDWNRDGKKDMMDDFIEYNIYKESTKNNSSGSYNGGNSSGNYNSYNNNNGNNSYNDYSANSSGCGIWFWIFVIMGILGIIGNID